MRYRPNLSTDVLFEILSDAHRRAAIRVLLDADRRKLPFEARELARRVTSITEETPPRDVSGTDVESVLTVLLHIHFPKLSRHGVIDYDRDERLVDSGPNCEAFQAPLESVDE
jgi:hypothetical protein